MIEQFIQALGSGPASDAAATDSITTILDSMDALVYVADLHSHELIFINRYGRAHWGEPQGRTCYQHLQSGQDSPCSFCTNARLLDAQGQPNPPYVWEFQNTVNGRWYQCRDQAIRWVDGRYVRLEIAVDISELKQLELQLRQAKEEAEALARIDPLTRIPNRRAFFEQMTQQLAMAARSQVPLCLVMMDVDHFKSLNDRYGHEAGDDALLAIARSVQDSIRDSDQLFRFGGEEFMLIVPDCELPQMTDLVDRIRLAIAALRIPSHGHHIHLTCSFGIARYHDASSIAEMIREADAALYHAKAGGRNQARFHGEIAA